MAQRLHILPKPVYIRTDDQAAHWASYYADVRPVIAIDTETTGLDIIRDRIKFFSFADSSTRICGPVRLLGHFADLLVAHEPVKVLANRNYDAHMLMNHGIHMTGNCRDVIQMDWQLDENRENRHGLKMLAADYCGLKMATFSEVFGAIGGTEREVRMVGHIHDILELNDLHPSRSHEATDLAINALLEMGRITSDDEHVVAALDLLAKMRGSGTKRTLEDVCKIARKGRIFAGAAGVNGIPLDLYQYVNGRSAQEDFGKNASKQARVWFEDYKEWLASFGGDATDLELEIETRLLAGTRISSVQAGYTPVEALRLMVADYASMDAYATCMVFEELRALLMKESDNLDDYAEISNE